MWGENVVKLPENTNIAIFWLHKSQSKKHLGVYDSKLSFTALNIYAPVVCCKQNLSLLFIVLIQDTKTKVKPDDKTRDRSITIALLKASVIKRIKQNRTKNQTELNQQN